MVKHKKAHDTTNISHLLTIQEVAQYLRCDPTTVRRWVGKGILDVLVLPHTGKRRVYRVRQSTLDNILAGNA